MSLKPTLLLLLVCHICFSQLSVRNSSYVFINNQIVFVEDDINLNETASTIYLRNEAQVIQGTGTTGNSGEGELTVYQEANVGEYEYNFWCSPVGNKTNNFNNNPFGISLLNDVVDLTNSDPAIIAHVTGYNSLSSPLTIEPYWIWKFIASDEYSEWIHVLGNTSINSGEGFTMKGTVGSGDAQRYDFRGKPNTGTIAVNVLANQFTLVGNPYPSALDAFEYIHDTDNAAVISGTLYYWEQNPNVNSHNIANYDGGYASYTIDALGVETYTPATFRTYDGAGNINGSSGTPPSGKTPRRYIPVGQGFMVEGTATGMVQAKNNHRVFIKETDANSEFFKTSSNKTTESKSTNTTVPNDYKRFRLNIDFNNTYTRQIVETFHPTATNDFDYGLESKLNENDILKSDAYWFVNNKPYIAEALPFDETLTIPIEVRLENDIPVRFRIADIQNFKTNQPIFLHDIETATYFNLRNQDFEINLNKGLHTNRFEITFAKNSLDIADNIFADFKIFQNNNIAQLNLINPTSIAIKSINVFDVSGKRVFANSINSAESLYSYSTKSFSDGVYIVKIESLSNEIVNKKIVISNKNN